MSSSIKKRGTVCQMTKTRKWHITKKHEETTTSDIVEKLKIFNVDVDISKMCPFKKGYQDVKNVRMLGNKVAGPKHLHLAN